MAALLARAPRCPEKVLDALVTLAEKAPTGYDLSDVLKLLGEYAHPKAAPVLQRLLDHANVAVSKAAFDALSRIPGALTPEVTKSLLQSKDEARRISAAEALVRRDDLSGLPVVVDVLRNGTTARADAARALGGFRARAAVEPLIDALLDADLTVRANAYNSLARVLPALFPYRRFDLASLGYVTTDVSDRALRRGRPPPRLVDRAQGRRVVTDGVEAVGDPTRVGARGRERRRPRPSCGFHEPRRTFRCRRTSSARASPSRAAGSKRGPLLGPCTVKRPERSGVAGVQR